MPEPTKCTASFIDCINGGKVVVAVEIGGVIYHRTLQLAEMHRTVPPKVA